MATLPLNQYRIRFLVKSEGIVVKMWGKDAAKATEDAENYLPTLLNVSPDTVSAVLISCEKVD